MSHEEVKVGQVWQDWDSRFRNGSYVRLLTVKRVEGDYAYCDSYGRLVRIKLSRFRPNSTGYKLVEQRRRASKGRARQ